MKIHSRSTSAQGFSMVEILVALAVVGLLAFMALPKTDSSHQSASDAENQHYAQAIVSVYQSGFAAGVAWSGSTRNAKIDSVIAGQAPTGGAFSGKAFKAPRLRNSEKAGCYKYIGCDSNGDLFYDKSGGQPSM